jgi:hypothetical protein
MDTIEDERARPGTKADRKAPPPWLYVVLGAFLVTVIVGVTAVIVGLGFFNRQQEAIVGGCDRLQTERERANINSANIYIVLKAASASTRSKEAKVIYDLGVRTSFYSPPANCDAAVKDPEHYKQPPVEPFDHLPDDFPLDILEAARQGQPQPTPP